MSKFIQSALKTLFVLVVVFTGTIGLLAAKNFERKLDAAVQELAHLRRDAEARLSAANEELAVMQQQQAAALDSAARWRGKFEHLCAVVEQAAGDAASGTMSVLK